MVKRIRNNSDQYKLQIHTTLDRDIKLWLENEARYNNKSISLVIADLVMFYKKSIGVME